MIHILIDTSYLPVILTALTTLILLLIRPSFLIKSNADKVCPYCIRPWLVFGATIAVGIGSYMYLVDNNFMDIKFLSTALTALSVLLILITRPSFLIRSNMDKTCPYCMRPWLILLITLGIGSVAYMLLVTQEDKPSFDLY